VWGEIEMAASLFSCQPVWIYQHCLVKALIFLMMGLLGKNNAEELLCQPKMIMS